MFRRWNFTVFSEIPSRAAISLFRRPSVTSAQDVELALREPVVLADRRDFRRPGLREEPDDPERRRRGDRGLAAADRIDHRSELRPFEALEQIAPRARPDRLEQVVLLLGDREHDDGDIRLGLADPAGGLQPSHPGHPDVHEHELGQEGVDEGDRLRAIRGLPDHLVAPGVEQGGHAVAEEGVVVRDEDPHHEATAAAGDAIGTSRVTTAPPSTPFDHAIRAPIAAARSRIAACP